jgi:hypothetical protein
MTEEEICNKSRKHRRGFYSFSLLFSRSCLAWRRKTRGGLRGYAVGNQRVFFFYSISFLSRRIDQKKKKKAQRSAEKAARKGIRTDKSSACQVSEPRLACAHWWGCFLCLCLPPSLSRARSRKCVYVGVRLSVSVCSLPLSLSSSYSTRFAATSETTSLSSQRESSATCFFGGRVAIPA